MLLMRERLPVSAGLLPAPAPLPSLRDAFGRRAALFGPFDGEDAPTKSDIPTLSRRSAIFGAVMTSGALVSPAARVEKAGQIAQPSADTCLTAMAAEVDRTLDGAAYALAPDEPADQDTRLYHAEDLMRRMSEIPAVGQAGVLAKAKAWLDSDSYDVQEGATLAESLCQDIELLFGGGAHA